MNQTRSLIRNYQPVKSQRDPGFSRGIEGDLIFSDSSLRGYNTVKYWNSLFYQTERPALFMS